MFHFESKNQYLNFIADVLYMFAIIYLMNCFNRGGRNNLEYIIVGIILPAIAVIEMCYVILTKRLKSLSGIAKIRLIGTCCILCCFVDLFCSRNSSEIHILALFCSFGLLCGRMCSTNLVTLKYLYLLFCKNAETHKILRILAMTIIVFISYNALCVLLALLLRPIISTGLDFWEYHVIIVASSSILLKYCAIAAWSRVSNK